MSLEEKSLYPQIHPLKLFTDWSTGMIALYPFWQHNLVLALLIALIPAPIVSFLLMRFANLENYKESSFGKYVRKYMTRQAEAIRIAGYAVTVVGAWYHMILLIPFGLVIILFGWLGGFIFPDRSD
jgi:hypothetical protein